MSKNSDHQAEYEKQRKDYANRLPETVRNINETWQKLCNISWDDDDFSVLSTAVHKLAGTASNYGFEEVSRRALMLDQSFKQIEDSGIPSEAEKQQIEARLLELDRFASMPADKPAGLNLPETEAVPVSDLVYIVDDDEDASRYFEVILKSAGYATSVFSSLGEFHLALEHNRPDLIIMDIIFPEGKFAGIEAINQLGTELGKSIPIIFVSVRSDVQARIRALRAGGCAYITKPVVPETLLSAVASNSSVEQESRRVLVIDDDPITLSYCETLLKNNHYAVSTSLEPMETLQAIESFHPDVVVMDYNMPAYNGDELVKMLRQDQRYVNLPVVMVTADKDPAVEEKVRLLGNTRFLAKPINNERFLETVAESIKAACRSQKRMLDILKQYPHGLLNLYYFYSELESIIAAAGHSDYPYTLLYFAIDDPASIRERVGLRKLVQLNKQISSYLLSLIGKNELISQLTEFVYLILIRVEDPTRLKTSIDTLKNRLKSEVFTVDDVSLSVTASIGAISISPKINSVDEVVSKAEKASIEAGKDGGNRVNIILSEQSTALSGSDIGRAFMEAFKSDKLRLQYQPIVNIATSESVYEAYARFIAGERIITPEQFMPFMEEYSLEYEFNKKIVIAAVHDIVRSADISHGEARAVIIVKLEPTRQTMLDFMGWFEAYLDTNRININNKLIFSFRENWVLKNHDNYKRFMKKARQLNCGLALERVGLSKYSADLVEAIAPAYCKLDTSFVNQLLSSYPEETRDVLKRLQATDTHVVATAVENADTFAKLMALGIDHFQGYIVQQPGTGLDFSISQHYF